MGKSAIGPGLKAGSLEYVSQFMTFTETAPPQAEPVATDHRLLQLAQEWRQLVQWGKWPELRSDIEQTISAIHSDLHQMETRYGRIQDYFHLRGQDNLLRYLPIRDLVIRLHPDDSLFETLARIAAASIADCTTRISLPEKMDNAVTAFLDSHHGCQLLHGMRIERQSNAQLAAQAATIGRIRYAAADRVPSEIFTAAAKTGASIARTPVYMEGRIELLHYFQQQSICDNYHRYGNLGERSLE